MGFLLLFVETQQIDFGQTVKLDVLDNGKVVSKQYNENSPQVVECLVVLEVLKTFLEPLNIVSDSCYVVNAGNLLDNKTNCIC